MEINIDLDNFSIPKFKKIAKRVMRHLKYGEGNLIIILSGGRSTTKSSLIAFLILCCTFIYKDSIACLRLHQNNLRDSVVAQLVETAKRMKITKLLKLGKSPMFIENTTTGAVIKFFGTSDAGKTKSNNANSLDLDDEEITHYRIVWIEEAYEHSFEDIEKVIIPTFIRGDVEGGTVTFLSYNPPRDGNASILQYTEFMKDNPMAEVCHTTYLDVPEKWLGKAFIQNALNLKKRDESEYNHIYLGEVSSISTKIYNNYKFATLTDEDIQYLVSYGDMKLGLDHGYSDGNGWIRAVIMKDADGGRDKLFIIDEFYLKKLDPVEYKTTVLAHQLPDEELICDNNRPDIIALFSKNSYNHSGEVEPPIKVRGVDKHKISVANQVQMLSSLIEIVIDPERTPTIAWEIERYVRDLNDKTGVVSFEPKKNQTEHCLDAMRYSMYDYLRDEDYITKEINNGY